MKSEGGSVPGWSSFSTSLPSASPFGKFYELQATSWTIYQWLQSKYLKIWRKFLMKSTAAVGDGFFFEFQSLTNFEFPSITSTVKDGWGGQNPCPRSLNLKVWEDLWHSKSSISMLWLGWSSFSTSARCTSTTDEMKIRGGQNPCPLLSVKMNLTSIFLSSTFPGLSLPCIKLVSVFSCIWCHCW